MRRFWMKKTQPKKYAMTVEQLRTHVTYVMQDKEAEKSSVLITSNKDTNLETIAKATRLQGYIDALDMVLWWTREEGN
jgi:hypothetical protein